MSTGAVEQEASLLALADVVLSVDQVCSHRHSAVHGTRIRMPKTRSGSGAVPARLRQAHASTVNQDCIRPTRGQVQQYLDCDKHRWHVDSELNTGVVHFFLTRRISFLGTSTPSSTRASSSSAPRRALSRCWTSG